MWKQTWSSAAFSVCLFRIRDHGLDTVRVTNLKAIMGWFNWDDGDLRSSSWHWVTELLYVTVFILWKFLSPTQLSSLFSCAPIPSAFTFSVFIFLGPHFWANRKCRTKSSSVPAAKRSSWLRRWDLDVFFFFSILEVRQLKGSKLWINMIYNCHYPVDPGWAAHAVGGAQQQNGWVAEEKGGHWRRGKQAWGT